MMYLVLFDSNSWLQYSEKKTDLQMDFFIVSRASSDNQQLIYFYALRADGINQRYPGIDLK